MPCFCWIDDKTLDEGRSQLRKHAKEMVKIMKKIDDAGHIPPDKDELGSGCILNQTKKLIDHLYTGKCDEKCH